MGGLRQTPSEQVIVSTSILVFVGGGLLLPLLILLFLLFLVRTHQDGIAWIPHELPAARDRSVHPALWAVAAASILVWLPILPFTQAEQQRRSKVERLVFERRLEDALATMSQFERSDFPPHWEPPPWSRYDRFDAPDLGLAAAALVVRDDNRTWVGEFYVDQLLDPDYRDYWFRDWRPPLSDVDWRMVAEKLAKRPDGPSIAAKFYWVFHPRDLLENRRDEWAPIVELAKQVDPKVEAHWRDGPKR